MESNYYREFSEFLSKNWNNILFGTYSKFCSVRSSIPG